MDRRSKTIFSIVLKFFIFIFSTTGIVLCLLSAGGFMSGSKIMFKYFTVQSNVFTGICSLVLTLALIKKLKAGKYELSHTAEVIHLMSTVSITLTGLIYCCVLFPVTFSTDPASVDTMLTPHQLILHIVVPVLSIIDFLEFTRPTTYRFSKKDILWSIIPPLYYLGFSRIGYVMNWDFGGGNNYPYFFLNYNSPAAFFGFTGQPPYFMGVFWWLLAILALVLIISELYTAIVNKAVKKYMQKLI